MNSNWTEIRAASIGAQAFALRRCAARLPADLPVLLCDGVHPAESLAQAAELRRAGEPFAVGLCIEDPAAILARRAAGMLMQQISNPAERAAAFERIADGTLEINGTPLHEHEIFTREQLQTIREFLSMGDALAVRSQTERRHIEKAYRLRFRHVLVLPLSDPEIPRFTADPDADRVCIWAPHTHVSELAIYIQALAASRCPAIIVTDGAFPGTQHEYISPAQAHHVLPRVRVLIDTNLADPGSVIAFAKTGVRICHPIQSGGHEYADGTVQYHPSRANEISAAISRARGAAPARLRRLPDIAEARAILSTVVPPEQPNAPLVSVVVPTYNRPALLRRALDTLSRQTYRNIEVVVVNDAGEPVGDIVAEYPFATYLPLDKNVGPCAALNAGLRAAKGAYLAVIADDDMHYPTHFSYLVHAARESGLAVVHSDAINNLVQTGPDGEPWTTGYHLSHDGDLDPISVHWEMVITGLSLFIDRDTYEKIGYWDADRPVVGDYDILIRLARAYDFAHVPVVTGEFRVRDDGSTISNKNTDRFLEELQALFNRYDLPGRPCVVERQAEAFESAKYKKLINAAFFPCWMKLAEPRRMTSYPAQR